MSAAISLLGIPSDVGSSFLRGPAAAPPAIRRALGSSHWHGTIESGEDPLSGPVEDVGDVPLKDDAGDRERITQAVTAQLERGRRVLALGGDHAVTYPVVRAVAAAHGPLHILHFDAHPDIYPDYQGDPYSHASPFARILEEGLAASLTQLGIRTLNPVQAAQQARYGVTCVEMRRMDPATIPVPAGPLYISIDLDVLDPAFAPGVSHYEPGGLSTRELLRCLERVSGPVLGADIVELNPSRDIQDMTATVAAKLVREMAGLMLR